MRQCFISKKKKRMKQFRIDSNRMTKVQNEKSAFNQTQKRNETYFMTKLKKMSSMQKVRLMQIYTTDPFAQSVFQLVSCLL